LISGEPMLCLFCLRRASVSEQNLQLFAYVHFRSILIYLELRTLNLRFLTLCKAETLYGSACCGLPSYGKQTAFHKVKLSRERRISCHPRKWCRIANSREGHLSERYFTTVWPSNSSFFAKIIKMYGWKQRSSSIGVLNIIQWYFSWPTEESKIGSNINVVKINWTGTQINFKLESNYGLSHCFKQKCGLKLSKTMQERREYARH
jgi:hypothetical protein